MPTPRPETKLERRVLRPLSFQKGPLDGETRWGLVTLALHALDQAGVTVDRLHRVRTVLEEDNAFGGDQRNGYNPILAHCEHEPPCLTVCGQVCSVCEKERELGAGEEPAESGWRDCAECRAAWPQCYPARDHD